MLTRVRVTRIEVDCGNCGATFGTRPGVSPCPSCGAVTVIECAEPEPIRTSAGIEAAALACGQAASAGALAARRWLESCGLPTWPLPGGAA